MSSLKEQIANTPDLMEKSISFKIDDTTFNIKIRRLTVEQRDTIFEKARSTDGEKGGVSQVKKGSDASCEMVVLGVVGETLTLEEVKKFPALVVEEIAKKIMHFNGWTVEGQRFLDDNFPSKN